MSRRPPLTRARIVDAALFVMDRDGLDAVSMRRIAREVGVEAMSLYHHVRDKEDLLDAVLERVMGEFEFPDDTEDWATQGREVARSWRRLLNAHPNVIPVFAERHKPMTTVDALRPMEVSLRVLRRAGLTEIDAVQAFHVIGGYIFGFVVMETGGMFHPGRRVESAADVAGLPDELPCVAWAIPLLETCDLDAQFEFGLDLMLEGLRAKASRPSSTASQAIKPSSRPTRSNASSA